MTTASESEPITVTPEPPRPRRGFPLLWFGQSVSNLGDQVSLVALPTISVLLLHATPFQLGLIGTVGTLGYPMFGLIAGVYVDRTSRRKIMMTADVVRMCALASIPVAYAFHVLGLGQMGVVAAIVGSAAVFFDVGYQSYLPALVAEYDLAKGNSRMEITSSAAQAGGPPLAGLLIQLVGAANAIIVDSTSYLVSVLSLSAIRHQETMPERPRGNLWPQARQGVRIVFRHPLLSRLVVTSACANLGRGLALELFILYVYRALKFSPGVAGAVLAAGAVATLVGAAVCTRLVARIGLGNSMLLSTIVKGIPWMFVPFALVAAPIPIMIVIMMVSSFFLPVWNINTLSLRQYLTDSAVLGRVSATVRTVAWATVPVSALLGGVMAQAGVALWGNRTGLAAVLAVGGLMWTCSVFALPIRKLSAVRTPKDAADTYGRVVAPE